MTKRPAPSRPTLLQAMTSPAWFGPSFRGASWKPWLAFAAALTGEPLNPEQLALFQQCTGRTAPPQAPFREAALICGRRAGKSRLCATIAVYLAIFRDYQPHLAPGEVATIAVLARDRKQARNVFRMTSGLLKTIPILASMIVAETDELIELNNRVTIEITTASFRSTRGYKFGAVICDEIAFWQIDGESANPDQEIVRALRPGLLDMQGLLIMASSPYGQKGELYNRFRKHYGQDDAKVLVWKASTETMRPNLPEEVVEEIKQAYEDDPEYARAEFGAEFRQDLANYITADAIEAVTTPGCRERAYDPAVTYSGFCDPSGGINDSFVAAIGHRDGELGIVDALLEVRARFSPDDAVRDVCDLLRRYNVSRVVADRFAGLWPVPRFAEHGITLEQSARPKSDIYHDLLPLINSRRVELLDHPRCATQFINLQRRVSRAGKDAIAEPPGGRDDLANSVAGLLVGLDLDRRAGQIARRDMLDERGLPAVVRPSVEAIFASTWVGLDGRAAWCLWAYQTVGDRWQLVLIDYDVGPWTPALMPAVVAALNVQCDALLQQYPMLAHRRLKVSLLHQRHTETDAWAALVASPLAQRPAAAPLRWQGTQLAVGPAQGAVNWHIALAPMAVRRLDDPEALIRHAAALLSQDAIKLSATAEARSATRPLYGVLGVRPGERIDNDPLRVAYLLGVTAPLN